MSAQAIQDEDLIILSDDNNTNDLLNFSFDDTTVSSWEMISFDNSSSNTSNIELFDDIKADTVWDLFWETFWEIPSVVNNLTIEPSLQEEKEEIDLFWDISITNTSEIDSEIVLEITPIVSTLEETPKEEVKQFVQNTETLSPTQVWFDRNAILDETISKLFVRASEIDSILEVKQNEVISIESQIEELNKLKKEKNSEIRDLNTEKDSAKSDIEVLNQMKEWTSKKIKTK